MVDQGYRFVLGEPTLIKPGTDVTIFGTGQMVSLSLNVRERLKKEGIPVKS
jgi:transketolase C-terminal domain/subunit